LDTLTPEGPERYTVTASLSRRPDPSEVESLPALRVADRRLLISGTNLQELRNGLAAAVGTIVRTASMKVLAEKELARRAMADLDEAERERLLRVAEAAAAIDFGA
jgi:seryl-tRNA synthetase